MYQKFCSNFVLIDNVMLYRKVTKRITLYISFSRLYWVNNVQYVTFIQEKAILLYKLP